MSAPTPSVVNFTMTTASGQFYPATLCNDMVVQHTSSNNQMFFGVVGASNVLCIGSNTTSCSNLTVTGLTSLSNLTVSGNVTGFNGVSSNQSFSNVYSSNITASNATFSNVTVNSGMTVNGIVTSSNVGIGTSTPTNALDVVGNINCTGNISAGNMGMFRNRIMNGDMRVNQRGLTSITADNNNKYLVDRWTCSTNNTMGFATVTLTTSDTPFQYGLKTSIRVTSPSITGGYCSPMQNIEGTNMSDFMWGTGYGAPATLSFWCRVNLPSGLNQLPVRVSSVTNAYTYLSNVSIVSNGTWQYVSLTIPRPPTSSVWSTTSTDAYSVSIGVYGVSGTTTSYNTWTAGANLYPSSTNIYSTNGSYVEFTGVQLEKGTLATPYEFRPFATELALCQRYFNTSYEYGTTPGTATMNGRIGLVSSGANIMYAIYFPVTMRTTAAVSVYGGNNGALGYVNRGGTSENLGATSAGTSLKNALVYVGSATDNEFYYIHYAANAEI